MAGDVSRDFARLLSALHKDVVGLTKQVEHQQAEIEDLKKLITKTDDQAVKAQRTKLKRAVLSGNAADLDRASVNASTLLDEELIRQAQADHAYVEPIRFNVNNQLLQNMIGGQFAPVPKVSITVKEIKPAQPLPSKDLLELERNIIQDEANRANRAYRASEMETQRRESNALKKLSPLWKTDLDK